MIAKLPDLLDWHGDPMSWESQHGCLLCSHPPKALTSERSRVTKQVAHTVESMTSVQRGDRDCPGSRASTLQGQLSIFHFVVMGKASARSWWLLSGQHRHTQLPVFSLEIQQGLLFLTAQSWQSRCPNLKAFSSKPALIPVVNLCD